MYEKPERRSEQLAFRTTKTVARQIKTLARNGDLTLSELVEFLVKEYVEEMLGIKGS